MSVTLKIDNFGALNIQQKLILTQDIAIGVTSLPVVNSLGISANDFMIAGAIGTNFSEIIQATGSGPTPDTTHVVLGNPTVMQHKQFDPIWQLYGDQIKIYRAPNIDGNFPDDGTYLILDNMPIDISYDENQTSFEDTTGDNTWWYKATYYNSVTQAETLVSDSIAKRGGGYNTYTTIENIRREAGLYNNEFVTDAMIDQARYRAQFEIDGALNGLYNVPFQPPVNPMVSVMVEKLASSYLLSIDYGPMASGNSKDANTKMAEYQRLQTKIDNKSFVLTDVNGNDMANAGAGGNKSWPNDNTGTQNTPVDQGGSDRKFRYGMRF